jgi:transcription antitermination factor NusG
MVRSLFICKRQGEAFYTEPHQNMLNDTQAQPFHTEFAAPLDRGPLDPEATPQWFAVCTRSNHEKCAATHLEQRSIEHFLPTYESVRKWKDRRKRLQLPLFPGYIFVRIPLQERLRVLVTPGVVRLVGFDNRPAALPDGEIEALRSVLVHGVHSEPHPYLSVGRKVRITRGALAGMEGVLMRKKGRVRLVLSIDLIRQSAMIEVDSADVGTI